MATPTPSKTLLQDNPLIHSQLPISPVFELDSSTLISLISFSLLIAVVIFPPTPGCIGIIVQHSSSYHKLCFHRPVSIRTKQYRMKNALWKQQNPTEPHEHRLKENTLAPIGPSPDRYTAHAINADGNVICRTNNGLRLGFRSFYGCNLQ